MSAARLALLALLACCCLWAHVGSPDVYTTGYAGPYKVLVAVHPPSVIPGVAAVELQVLEGEVSRVRLVPLPMTGPGKEYPPTPDLAQRDPADPRRFTGSLWMMDFGSWEVKLTLDGARGTATYEVPVAAVATRLNAMQRATGIGLFCVMVVLVAGIASIAGAGAAEARLAPGSEAGPAQRRRGRLVTGGVLVFCAGVLWYGARWWNAEEAEYRNHVYKPLLLDLGLEQGQLNLALEDPGWLKLRKLDDLVPDHGHLMHLFLVRTPQMDRMLHLHPDQVAPGRFQLALPSLAAGSYTLFADVVHANGLAETATAQRSFTAISGAPLTGDDSAGSGPALRQTGESRDFRLPDGDRMVWLRDAWPLRVRRTEMFAFELRDAQGRRREDLEPYMGMAGHAEFLRADGQVFAHVHPSGSAAMSALMLTGNSMKGMHGAESATVRFPFGIPSAGRYRVFVQLRRGGHVETGIFDFTAEDK